MINKLKASVQLYLLIVVMSLFYIGIGAYGIYCMRQLNQNTKTIYNDRLYALQQLTTVRYLYAVGILSATEQASDGQISFGEATEQVQQSEELIQKNWGNYMHTYLTPDEATAAKQTSLLIDRSFLIIEKLTEILKKEDKQLLDPFIKNELYTAINPVINNMNSLVQLQMQVGGEVYKNSNAIYHTAIRKFFWAILISLFFVIPLSYYLILNIRNMIRDLRESNRKIKESEEKYRYLFENNPAYIIVWDLEKMEVLEVNETVVQKYGYSKEEWVGMSALKYRPEKDHDIITDFAKRMLGPDEPKVGMTWTHLTKSGEEMTMQISSHKIIYNGRKAILSLGRDITEEVKAQAALKKSEDIFHALVDHAADAIFMVLDNGIIFGINQSAAELLQYTKEEMIGRTVLDFHPPGIAEDIPDTVWNKLRQDKSLTDERHLQRKDGSLVEVEISRKMLPDASGAIAIVRDITERKKTEKEIKQTTEKLRELMGHLLNIREEERMRIGREIHDELGQQLTAMKMDVVWIDKKIPADDVPIKTKLKNTLAMLDGGNVTIRRIINELRPVILDDNGLFEALKWHGHKFTANTGIPVEFSAPETPVKIAEEISICLFRVFQESLTNITRYAKAKNVCVSVKIIEDRIFLSVEDDGQGFDPAENLRKKSFGILGMKERVIALHGNFELTSVPGKGTTIEVHIPFKNSIQKNLYDGNKKNHPGG